MGTLEMPSVTKLVMVEYWVGHVAGAVRLHAR